MSDIFISYASENRPIAQRLALALEAAGLSVWWDREIRVGSEWDKTIESALVSAKGVVVLWTRHAKESRWVRAEARRALQDEKIIPVMLEPDAIPLAFTGIQSLRLLGWDGSQEGKPFAVLLAVIRGHLEGKSITWPEEESIPASVVGKFAAVVGMKTGIGLLLAVLLIISNFVTLSPTIELRLLTPRLEFTVPAQEGPTTFTGPISLKNLFLQPVGSFSLRPDELSVANPEEYNWETDSYPPGAWLPLPVQNQLVHFSSAHVKTASQIMLETPKGQEGRLGQLQGIVLTQKTVVTLEVRDTNAVTMSFMGTEGQQTVEVNGLVRVEWVQDGLTMARGVNVPVPQDQELTFQAGFDSNPGIMKFVGEKNKFTLVLEPVASAQEPLVMRPLSITDVDFSEQEAKTGRRVSPRGFKGTVSYRTPAGLDPIEIEEHKGLSLDGLENFELTFLGVDSSTHQFVVKLQGKAESIKMGTRDNSRELRPTLFQVIQSYPGLKPLRNLIGL